MSFFELNGRVFSSKTGYPTIQVAGVNLHSQHNPVKEAERWVQSLPGDRPLILVGTGMGYAGTFLKSRSGIIYFEPVPVVAGLCRRGPCFASIKNAYITNLDDLRRKALELDPDRLTIAATPAYARLFPGIASRLEQYLCGKASTHFHFERTWMRNIYCRLKHPSLSFIRKIAFNRQPVFIGAAPGLQNEIKLLEKERQRYCFLASDTALPAMLQRGIMPDAVLSLDAGRGTAYHFEMLEKLPLTLPLQIPLITWLPGARAPERYFQEVHYYASTHPCDQISLAGLNLPVLEWEGGNVSGLAIALCAMAGAPQIVLAGISRNDRPGASHISATGYDLYRSLTCQRTLQQSQDQNYSSEAQKAALEVLQRNLRKAGLVGLRPGEGQMPEPSPAALLISGYMIPTRSYLEKLKRSPRLLPEFLQERYYQIAAEQMK